MGDLMQEILDKLKEISNFNFVAIYNNQFQFVDNGGEYSFPFPCAFVELTSTDLQDIGGGYQGSDLQVSIHLGQDYYNSTANLEQNLSIFNLRDLIIKKLASFKPSTGSGFVKISEAQDFDHSNVYHYVVSYKFHWIDSTAVNPDILSPSPINLIINN